MGLIERTIYVCVCNDGDCDNSGIRPDETCQANKHRMRVEKFVPLAIHREAVGLLREALPRVIQADGEYGYEDDLVDRISAVVGEPPEMSSEEFLGPESVLIHITRPLDPSETLCGLRSAAVAAVSWSQQTRAIANGAKACSACTSRTEEEQRAEEERWRRPTT